MAYRIPGWLFVSVGGAAAAGAVMDSNRRSTWLISGGLGLLGLMSWNLYTEARTIEAVVEQGYIYGAPPQAAQDAQEPMSGWGGYRRHQPLITE